MGGTTGFRQRRTSLRLALAVSPSPLARRAPSVPSGHLPRYAGESPLDSPPAKPDGSPLKIISNNFARLPISEVEAEVLKCLSA